MVNATVMYEPGHGGIVGFIENREEVDFWSVSCGTFGVGRKGIMVDDGIFCCFYDSYARNWSI